MCLAQSEQPVGGKHEVGLNVGPSVLVSLGGKATAQAQGLYYKRLTEKGAWRFQLTNVGPSLGGNTNFWQYREDFSAMDSTLVTRQGLERNRAVILWSGKEYRLQKQNGWAFTYGFDLGLSYGFRTFEMQDVSYSGTYLVDPVGVPRNYNYGNLEGVTDVAKRETRSYGLGSRVTVGALKALSPRFFLHLQSGLTAFAYQNEGRDMDYQTGLRANFSTQSLEFNTGPFIHELGLYYRF